MIDRRSRLQGSAARSIRGRRSRRRFRMAGRRKKTTASMYNAIFGGANFIGRSVSIYIITTRKAFIIRFPRFGSRREESVKNDERERERERTKSSPFVRPENRSRGGNFRCSLAEEKRLFRVEERENSPPMYSRQLITVQIVGLINKRSHWFSRARSETRGRAIRRGLALSPLHTPRAAVAHP